ncbi:MAG: DUF4298 domain-containing protein [Ruminococcus sp.]|nr:DUF4298 domain-containing protein [Ruminococcus sp.]
MNNEITMNEQIKRIEQMEEIFDKVSPVVKNLENAIDEYLIIKDDITKLENYYSSGDWREDYNADEAGMIPADIKRGVLSQDSVYDLLADHDALVAKIKALF